VLKHYERFSDFVLKTLHEQLDRNVEAALACRCLCDCKCDGTDSRDLGLGDRRENGLRKVPCAMVRPLQIHETFLGQTGCTIQR